MAEKLDEKEPVTFNEMLIRNSIQVEALTQLLIEKGLITENEFYWKVKDVQMEFQSKRSSKRYFMAMVLFIRGIKCNNKEE